MDHEEALSIIEPIVGSIDEKVEVRVTQTSEEWDRSIFRVHLSKWGIVTVLQITFEDIVNARPDDRELRARLEEGIQHIREQREWKVIVDGTIGMLQPLLVHLVAEQGLSAQRSSGHPDWASGEWHFASFRINKQHAEGRSHSLGTIALQGLPEQRVEVTFIRTVGGKLPPKEPERQFIAFYDKFIRRLVERRFLEKPPPPKEPMGFRHD